MVNILKDLFKIFRKKSYPSFERKIFQCNPAFTNAKVNVKSRRKSSQHFIARQHLLLQMLSRFAVATNMLAKEKIPQNVAPTLGHIVGQFCKFFSICYTNILDYIFFLYLESFMSFEFLFHFISNVFLPFLFYLFYFYFIFIFMLVAMLAEVLSCTQQIAPMLVEMLAKMLTEMLARFAPTLRNYVCE